MATAVPTSAERIRELPLPPKSPAWHSKLRWSAFALIVLVGLLRDWVGRYSISPDGVCYLDMGDAFFKRHWSEFINGYWSPLYPWLLGAAAWIVKPSSQWQLPLAHVVNFAIFLAAFVCFEFFLRSMLDQMRRQTRTAPEHQSLSEPYLLAIGYSLFLWTSLDLITIWDLSPDLLVAAFVYLIAALLLRLRSHASITLYISFGVVLGFAYFAKAVMFPLGFAFVLIGLFCVPRTRRLQYLVLVMTFFLGVSAPWIAALSHAKGRLTFGDSGRLAYSALVSPGGRLLNWQGDTPGSGTPLHTTRRIHQNPPVYEFANPVGGTYPPAYDPSYWNEGRKWTFDARTQLSVIKDHVLLYGELLLHSQSGLLAGVLALLLAAAAPSRKAILHNWPLFCLFLAVVAVYTPVHVELRFLGAFVTIFWMAILSGVLLARSESRKLPDFLALAMAATILISVADGSVRAIRAGGPYSARDHIAVAEGLEKLGLNPGDPIAVLGDGNWSYWARLGKFKIVSTIVQLDTPAFWADTRDQQQGIYSLLAATGAKAVISAQVPASDLGNGWKRVAATDYYVRWLSAAERGFTTAVQN